MQTLTLYRATITNQGRNYYGVSHIKDSAIEMALETINQTSLCLLPSANIVVEPIMSLGYIDKTGDLDNDPR